MSVRSSVAVACLAAIAALTARVPVVAQTDRPQTSPSPTLRAVVVVSRHGVRSPTDPTELTSYVGKAWPAWEVAPGFLTPHGATLMSSFGAAYRARYAAQGLVPSSGCPSPGSVYVWADVDERTKATASALLDGFAPHCGLVASDLGAANDPLFHSIPQAGKADAALSAAAIGGSLGDDPSAIVPAHRLEVARLEAILGCQAATCTRISSVPSIVKTSAKTGLSSVEGGVDLASTAVEDLILAYVDGKSMNAFGDASIDARTLLELSQLHVLKSELTTQTPYISRVQGSNLLTHLGATIDELATDTPNGKTRVPADARFVALVGHDTNLSTLAGILRLRWLMPGYQLDDTPPGGALVFEIYTRAGASPFVRTFYTAQSLDQMRSLSAKAPARVPVFVPGCTSLDCSLGDFDRAVTAAVDPAFVVPW